MTSIKASNAEFNRSIQAVSPFAMSVYNDTPSTKNHAERLKAKIKTHTRPPVQSRFGDVSGRVKHINSSSVLFPNTLSRYYQSMVLCISTFALFLIMFFACIASGAL